MVHVGQTMAIHFATPTARVTRAHAVLPTDGVETLPLTAVQAVSLAALSQHREQTQQHLDLMLVADPRLQVRHVIPTDPLADAVRQSGIVGMMLRTAQTGAKVAA